MKHEGLFQDGGVGRGRSVDQRGGPVAAPGRVEVVALGAADAFDEVAVGEDVLVEDAVPAARRVGVVVAS